MRGAAEGEGASIVNAEILLSLPGIGPASPPRCSQRLRQASEIEITKALRNYAGAAPITRRSGKRKWCHALCLQ